MAVKTLRLTCVACLLCWTAPIPSASFRGWPARYPSWGDYTQNNRFSGIRKTDNMRLSVEEEINWPQKNTLKNIRQVSGIDVDKLGNVHVLHRGDRAWNMWSFDGNNYQLRELGPIKDDTVLILNQSSGEVIRKWGKNRFYLPHGLTVDNDGNSWITDVALHQVFKFTPNNEKPSIVLGEEFTPGSDRMHFCKPTDVAVTSSGYIFISDGYCNSRIIAFKPNGTFYREFGKNEKMIIPHSLSMIEEKKYLCVADRENARILCYSVENNDSFGKLSLNYDVPTGAVYAIAYAGENMFAVTLSYARGGGAMGITMKMNNGNIINTWHSHKGFSMPHDIAISSNGTNLYVVDVGEFAPKKLFKFLVFDVI